MAVTISKTKVFVVHIFMLIALTIAAGFTNIASFTEPFNPITLNILLIGLSIVGYINSTITKCKKLQEEEKGVMYG